MSFIIAGLIALGTIAFAALQVGAAMMHPTGGDLTGTAWTPRHRALCCCTDRRVALAEHRLVEA